MPDFSKKELSEQDICSKFILPALTNAGWDLQKQIREQYSFTAGRIIVRGKSVFRGEKKRVDFVLYHRGHLPLAVIEAKDNKHPVGAGMQQALEYAEALDVPFVYSSNGDAFLEHNRLTKTEPMENEFALNEFPSPDALYSRYVKAKGLVADQEKVISQDYYQEIDGKSPRYFQQVAINRATEEIVKGKNRLLLVMATGTGKTYAAFQIIWRLWKAGVKKRILFLVDRNILADQPIMNDFRHFGDKMTKIQHRSVDKSYEVYLGLYQGLTGMEEEKNIFKQFSSDFFDLVIVDECHRGAAREDASWREILDYYKSATQIGLTATPKETADISTQTYFGDPVYTYSLRQGIEDGYLAPYKVIRVTLDRDAEGYRPMAGEVDKYGNPLPDQVFGQSDFDRKVVLEERSKVVAQKITEYLKATDRMQKTIVFCVDIEHADRMRQELVNANADLVSEHPNYVVRITGDSEHGARDLDKFIDPESPYPVIATTSKLLTTGVDTQTVKLIVIDQNINSIIEFKQIIGRGTRVREDYGKMFFTIMDFRGATELFADPKFDGDPVVIYKAKEKGSVIPPEEKEGGTQIGPEGKPNIEYGPPGTGVGIVRDEPKKYYPLGVEVKIINERVQYMDERGKLITESLKDYTKRNILQNYASLNDFLTAWTKTEQKDAILKELEDRGVFFAELSYEVGRDLDAFDLICHVAWGKKPLTRGERAEKARKKDYFAKYEGKAREVIEALLAKYADQGITAIDDIGDLQVSPFNQFGTPYQIVNDIFGGRENYLTVVRELQRALYAI
ncbi:MAG: DEAD/DEAH box helicase family protein [Candidatus Sungbacteria bacterium]|nr:DEAD/DEAH box helicase family protein [Candidatus Sungbacteria bacterium]